MMRRKKVEGSLALLTLLVCCLLPGTATGAQTTTSPVPVVICITGNGVSWAPGWTPPKSVSMPLPSGEAQQVVMYMADQGYPRVLGPKGWWCSASVGADGNGSLEVGPSGAYGPPYGHRWTADRGISVQVDPACLSCRLELACPFFAAARQQYKKYYPSGTGCSPAPPTETLFTLDSDTVAFSDPPRLIGDGNPSGGRNTANGVALFSPQAVGSAVSTCTLPNSQRWLCTASLDQVVKDYQP
jgi:hypothetical protein